MTVLVGLHLVFDWYDGAISPSARFNSLVSELDTSAPNVRQVEEPGRINPSASESSVPVAPATAASDVELSVVHKALPLCVLLALSVAAVSGSGSFLVFLRENIGRW